MPAFSKMMPLALGAATLAGCASSSLEGQVEGADFGKVESAFFVDESEGDLQEIILVLASYPEGCATYLSYLSANAEPTGDGPFHALQVRFLLYQSDPLAEGTWPIVPEGEFLPDGTPPETINALVFNYDDKDWDGPSAQSGSISIDTLEPALMAGTLEVTLTDGSTLEGKFKAEVCSP